MDQLLGLLDTLEASILDGKKVPFSDKVVINERQVLSILDRMRLAIKNDSTYVNTSLSTSQPSTSMHQPSMQPSQTTGIPTPIQPTTPTSFTPPKEVKDHIADLIKQAEKDAEKIKTGANDYADYILANLQLLITKTQTNLVKMERNITGGRKAIDDQKRKGEKPNLGSLQNAPHKIGDYNETL